MDCRRLININNGVVTNEMILDRYNDSDYDCIYGYMFGEPYINGTKNPDKIIKITKSELILSKNKDSFIWKWGYPGWDANIYYFSDYGRTWAYSDDEIEFL